MTRAILSVALCICAVAIGVFTAVTSANNRARGAELDRRQHRCEVLERQNDLGRALNGRAEWQLLYGEDDAHHASDAPDAPDDPTDSPDSPEAAALEANLVQ